MRAEAEAGHFNKLFNKLPDKAEGVCVEQGTEGRRGAAITAAEDRSCQRAPAGRKGHLDLIPHHPQGQGCRLGVASLGRGLGTGDQGKAGWRGPWEGHCQRKGRGVSGGVMDTPSSWLSLAASLPTEGAPRLPQSTLGRGARSGSEVPDSAAPVICGEPAPGQMSWAVFAAPADLLGWYLFPHLADGAPGSQWHAPSVPLCPQTCSLLCHDLAGVLWVCPPPAPGQTHWAVLALVALTLAGSVPYRMSPAPSAPWRRPEGWRTSSSTPFLP